MQSETTIPFSPRLLWAEWMRGIGILLVILGHVSAVVVTRWQDVTPTNWMTGNIYNVIARSCVPLLFMVSGALLLPRQESIGDFYRKRFQRVLFPFLIWSAFYVLTKQSFAGYTFVNAVKTITMIIITRPAEYHLWFMYELFGIYLLTPVFRVLVNKTRDEHLWYFIAIWLLFGPIQRAVEFKLQFELIFDLGYLTGYIGYFILGYLLTRIHITKPLLWVAALVYVAAGIFTGYATYFYSSLVDKLVDYYQYLLGLNIVLMAASLYILLKAWGEKVFSKPRPRLTIWMLRLSTASFGMYLVHVFILNNLIGGNFYKYLTGLFARVNFPLASLSPLDGPAIYMIPISTFVVALVSWIIIAILQKVPYLRSLVA